MHKVYSGWFGEFKVNPNIDFYGDKYWLRISNKTYEPDTMVFLENNLGPTTDFIDVGSATGAITLIAAKLGCRVLAFEAVPSIFEVARAHILSNPEISDLVTIRNNAISSKSGTLQIGSNADPKVLSRISEKDTRLDRTTTVEIVTLSDEVESFHKIEKKLVLKIDIEGAEWKLLSDLATCVSLRNHKALVLLAIHPGFNRPFKVLPLGLTFITKKLWQLQNLVVAYNFFRRLMKFATVKRTSLDIVSSPKKCVLLMFGGYFEFILDFNENTQ